MACDFSNLLGDRVVEQLERHAGQNEGHARRFDLEVCEHCGGNVARIGDQLVDFGVFLAFRAERRQKLSLKLPVPVRDEVGSEAGDYCIGVAALQAFVDFLHCEILEKIAELVQQRGQVVADVVPHEALDFVAVPEKGLRVRPRAPAKAVHEKLALVKGRQAVVQRRTWALVLFSKQLQLL